MKKCSNLNFCGKFRSSLTTVLGNQFLPPPYPVIQTERGLVIPEPDKAEKLKFAPLLVRLICNIKSVNTIHSPNANLIVSIIMKYCPSIKNSLKDRTCSDCGLYFASKKSLKIHSSVLHNKKDKLPKKM